MKAELMPLREALSLVENDRAKVNINCSDGSSVSLVNVKSCIHILAEFKSVIRLDYYTPYSLADELYKIGWRDLHDKVIEDAYEEYNYDVLISDKEYMRGFGHNTQPRQVKPEDYVNCFEHLWHFEHPPWNQFVTFSELIISSLKILSIDETQTDCMVTYGE